MQVSAAMGAGLGSCGKAIGSGPVEKARSIPRTLCGNTKKLEDLERELASLEQRLEPLMSQDGRSNSGEEEPMPSPSCEVHDILLRQESLIELIHTRVASLIFRLEA